LIQLVNSSNQCFQNIHKLELPEHCIFLNSFNIITLILDPVNSFFEKIFILRKIVDVLLK